jgi:hypothetical protein
LGYAEKQQAWLTRCRLFGFLLGATTSGAGMYYYVIDEYRVSNQLLTEDIYVRWPSFYLSNARQARSRTEEDTAEQLESG